MKKIAFIALTAIAAVTFVGCGNSTPKADLKDDIDTLSYAVGMAQTHGLKGYLVSRAGVDTAYINEFVKGVNDGVNAADDKKKAAYYAGLQIGQAITNNIIPGMNYDLFGDDSTKTVSLDNFMAGFISGILEKDGLMTPEQAQFVSRMKMQIVKDRQTEERYGPNKEAGEKFVAEYAKKEGVKALANGVYYRVLTEGKGEIPADTSFVEVRYEGKLIDGTVFESTFEREKPVVLGLNRVIKGWTEAITHMPVGSTWEVVIPQDQAYGAQKSGKIDPFSTLVFKIELVSITEDPRKAKAAKRK